MPELFKSGFVNIIGKPNAGKSTLINLLVQQPLCVVNPKAQTTRHRIRAIINGENYQVVLSDTPGIMKPANKLHERMLQSVEEVFDDSDVILFVHDIRDTMLDDVWVDKISKSTAVRILLLNKIDTIEQEQLEKAIEQYKAMNYWNEIYPISALHNFNTTHLIDSVVKHLPEGPRYFDDDQLTDRNERFFITEIIRERILALYDKEIPYSSEVAIERYKEEKSIVKIYATIFVMRESQKAIMLGNKGHMIKNLGIESRKRIEEFIQQKVYLELTVKVKDNWRNDDNSLKNFGY
ncbi:MAG: GTPase Era [Bacteroidetes bacterium]|nr:GTPase Era [Bacteroidota bacterium]